MKCTDCPIKDKKCTGERVKQLCELWKTGRTDYYDVLLQDARAEVKIEEPGILEKMGNAVKAVSGYALGGMRNVTAEEKQRRLEICYKCEYHGSDEKFGSPEGKCLKCGCYLYLKAGMATETCPIDKWGSHTPLALSASPTASQSPSIERSPLPPNDLTPVTGGCGCGGGH